MDNFNKDLKDKKKTNVNSTHMANNPYNNETPLHESDDNEQRNDSNMEDMLQKFTQFIRANQKTDSHFANMSYFGDFAGMHLSLLNSLRSDQFNKDTWILDTGATAHMCANLSSLNKISLVSKYTPVFLPDSTIKSVTHTGMIVLNPSLTLKNILHVPGFTCNLLSVKALAASANIAFIFYSTHCVLQDLETGKVLAYGKVVGNLYVLDIKSLVSVSSVESQYPCKSTHFCNVVQNSNKDNFSIWNKRLGHSSESTLNHLKFIPGKNNDESIPCIPCHEAKQKRLPFPNSNSSTNKIFDLIHVDLWGPYKLKTITNASYFLTIVEDFSRSTWTFLLQDKIQVYLTLKNFLSYVSNQFQTSIKSVRTDNGSEFVNSNCSTLFSSNGILHQRTTSYSPQQNGRVERKHQHLLQIARAVLFQAKLPIHFWGHAILMATHIINILPTQVLNWNTPFQKLYNKPPSYTNLKVFGCLCFATNTIPHKTKFDSRSTMCCFIGYSSGQKA